MLSKIRLIPAAIALLATTVQAQSTVGRIDDAVPGAYSFRGTFVADNDFVQIGIVPRFGLIRVYVVTYGYGGGRQADGTLIDRGGFAANAVANSEDGAVNGWNDDPACFASAMVEGTDNENVDPFTDALFDSCLEFDVFQGAWAGMSQWGNPLVEGLGFLQYDNPDYTSGYPECTQEFFCDETATPIYTNRTNEWAMDIIIVSAEPSDVDGDGVTDTDDNCTGLFNPSQYDSNGDGIGNLCDADITGPGGIEDCMVNFLDLGQVKAAFFTDPASPNWNSDADFDGDDVVNSQDLQIIRDSFFRAPGPSGVPSICDS